MTLSRFGRRYGSVVALSAIGLATLAGCGSNGGGDSSAGANGVTATTIKLGGTTPLSGPLGAGCHQIDGATEAWLKYVNSKGGVKGRQIEWKLLDDAYDPTRAAANARKLEASDIFAIFGGCGSLQPPAIMPIAQSSKVPYLFPVAPLSDVYSPVKPGIFGARVSYADSFVTLLQYALSTYGPGTVSSVLIQTPGIDKGIDDMKALVSKQGGEFNDNGLITAGTPDFTPYVLKLKQQNPDYVVINLTVGDQAKFLAAADEAGFSPRKKYLNAAASMADSSVTDQFQRGDKNTLAGKVLASSEMLPSNEKESADCNEAIKKYAPDLTLGMTEMTGCLVGEYLTGALEMTPEPLTRESFIKTLESLDNATLAANAGPVTMSPSNHLATSSLFLLELRDDGQFHKLTSVPLTGN